MCTHTHTHTHRCRQTVIMTVRALGGEKNDVIIQKDFSMTMMTIKGVTIHPGSVCAMRRVWGLPLCVCVCVCIFFSNTCKIFQQWLVSNTQQAVCPGSVCVCVCVCVCVWWFSRYSCLRWAASPQHTHKHTLIIKAATYSSKRLTHTHTHTHTQRKAGTSGRV